ACGHARRVARVWWGGGGVGRRISLPARRRAWGPPPPRRRRGWVFVLAVLVALAGLEIGSRLGPFLFPLGEVRAIQGGGAGLLTGLGMGLLTRRRWWLMALLGVGLGAGLLLLLFQIAALVRPALVKIAVVGAGGALGWGVVAPL